MKHLTLLEPIRKEGNYQFFMQWFADAWTTSGGQTVKGISVPWNLRLLIAKSRVSRNFRLFTSSRRALLVPGAGYPDSFAWPFGYANEIVPMLWDVWPRYWPRLISSLRRHHVQTLLCTSSQVCEYVAEKLPHIHAVHVPEGIDPAGYRDGGPLEGRRTDILQIGRLMQPCTRPFFKCGSRLPASAIFTRKSRAASSFRTFLRCAKDWLPQKSSSATRAAEPTRKWRAMWKR